MKNVFVLVFVVLLMSASTALAILPIPLPGQTGNSGKYLTTDGTNVSWGSPSISSSITEEKVIWVGELIDGTSAPGPLATLTSTNKVVYRDFSGTATNDVFVNWEVPYDLGATTTITFQVGGWITSATGPANDEGVSMNLSCGSYGSSDILSTALGTEVETTFVAANPTTHVQYDRWVTSVSNAVTVANIAAGESVVCKLRRVHDDTDDDYAQPIGVSWLKIKYNRALQ